MTTHLRASRQNGRRQESPSPPPPVRVAVYTRKSTEKGLDQAYTSLDAQQEAVEAFIASQQIHGWVALPEPYADGGFTGSNTERPAFQRLLGDIKAGHVDVVAVYRLDRLSRSQRDFFELIEFFEKHGVTFVSVTEQFNTTTPMGRFALSIAAAVAQLERETIAQRTKDKIHAMRRRGGYIGGRPVLGYNAKDKKLVVNEAEAERVRQIFQLYLDEGSLLSAVEKLRRRGWKSKSWTTNKGRTDPGRWFTKTTLHKLLTNVLYLGQVSLKGEVFDGQHDAIVPQELWDAVQQQLREKRGKAGRRRSKQTSLLQGLLRCGQCGSAMSYHYARRGTKQYGYYVCLTVQKQGAKACPGSRSPSGEMEQFVVERIRGIGRDPALIRETIEAAKSLQKERRPEIVAELRRLEVQKRQIGEERNNLLDAISHGGGGVATLTRRLGELDEQLAKEIQQEHQLRSDLLVIENATVDEDDLKAALAEFDDLWGQLYTKERARLLQLLIEEISYHAAEEEVVISFHPTGLRTLSQQHGGAA